MRYFGIVNLVLGWYYDKKEFNVLNKHDEIYDFFVEVNMYDCDVDVATHVMGNKIDCYIKVENNVKDTNVKVNEY